MAEYLHRRQPSVDAVVSSPAVGKISALQPNHVAQAVRTATRGSPYSDGIFVYAECYSLERHLGMM